MNPYLGFGLGLRAPHFQEILTRKTNCQWFEIISENYLGLEGYGRHSALPALLKIREEFPMVMHGVSMNIGSSDDLNFTYLERLKDLADIVQPAWMSDHLCWTGVHGQNSHDLLPLPYTQETVDHVAARIGRVQDFLKRNFIIENVSSYVEFDLSEMSEAEFLVAVCKKAGCGILLDINNIFVSSLNHGGYAEDYLKMIPKEIVGQFHLAGHKNNGNYAIDTHDQPVCADVWELYKSAVQRFGPISTMIEWDSHIPEFSVLEAELNKARELAR